ncbi:uncharacterized protein M6B38_360745 [Iris pallida]|uniref:Uncharacterized protein n=1 Tax=Iris pallida TaxID=29817 RepID=A0AAX6GJ31_IRIPA|nr:uncharacterized protein M6B38_360745 [Iris pallida]
MAGLLAWAADVVGGNETDKDDQRLQQLPVELAFTREQQQYALELDRRASDLRRSIGELRLRIPPADISQSLPHLHAHSLASNADLARQLNSHCTTKQQAQLREVTLQEENVAYEKAIANCQKKIQEKLQEADSLQAKLQELELIEKKARVEMEKALESVESSEDCLQSDDPNKMGNSHLEIEPPKDVNLQELEDKKRELSTIEEAVQRLEEERLLVQEESIKHPFPGQREKLLEKQLHSLVEQLTAKQVQAEALMSDIRAKEREVERVNGLRNRIDLGVIDASTPARNRFGRNIGAVSPGDYTIETYRNRFPGGRIDSQQKLMFLRSAFVLYILALHVIVFIKISF